MAENRATKVYGLLPGEYERLYLAQGGRCYACRRATGKTRRLSVDHDHRTGEVRGLLCRPCNTLLGRARDAVEFFQRFIDYLQYAERTGETFASKVLGRRVIVPTTKEETEDARP
ncbi:endonuclease VII domain-containing protein [Gordonia sp. N1V]|uniref:endonuclease VII domain-containing protein n=1 Tax=Gordonia sp. N1V TaxID=3034163 RepID=UPI0023E2009C|nr:endonuclease VII domain-containing protein [Gordonia sp. N1V]MDF3280889.1 endonuclease VII domain-containing protein [Gordonia sp. N1V]